MANRKFTQDDLDKLNVILNKNDYPFFATMLKSEKMVSSAELFLTNTNGLDCFTFHISKEAEKVIVDYFANLDITVSFNNTHTIFWAIGEDLSKNYISEVVKVLGIELGEKFNLKGHNLGVDNPYYITEQGIFNNEGILPRFLISEIIFGELEIVRRNE